MDCGGKQMNFNISVDILVFAIFSLMAILIFAALICQIFAMRHKHENWLHFAYKDSLFRNRQMAYTEKGMKFINAQKIISIMVVILAVILAYLTTDS